MGLLITKGSFWNADSYPVGWGLRFCITNQLQSDVNHAGMDHTLRSNSFSCCHWSGSASRGYFPSERLELTGASSHCLGALIRRFLEVHLVLIPSCLHQKPHPALTNLPHLTEPGKGKNSRLGQLAKSSSLRITNRWPIELMENMCCWFLWSNICSSNCSPSEKRKQRNQLKTQRSTAPKGTIDYLSSHVAGTYAHLQQLCPCKSSLLTMAALMLIHSAK